MQYAQDCIDMINKSLNNETIFYIDSNWKEVLPKISKSDLTIRYSSRFEISSLLLLSGDFNAVLDYWFGLSSLKNSSFSSSLFFINQLTQKSNNIIKKLKLHRASDSGLLEYMILFVILHEVAHGIYTRYPYLRENAFHEIEKELEIIYNNYSSCNLNKSSILNDLQKKRHKLDKLGLNSQEVMSKENLKVLFKNEQDDLDKVSVKEELACDLYSLSIAVHVVEFRGGSKEEYLKFYKASMLALILMSRYNFVFRRFVKLQDDDRYAMNKDAESIRLLFYNNECFQGLKSRKIDTTAYYNFIKLFPIDWLLSVKKYIEKHESLVMDSANRLNDQRIDATHAISCLEKFESITIEKYLM